MTETSRSINRERGSINHVYGDRHKTTSITSPHHFLIALRYVYQNPLKASLTTNLLTYPYTTFAGLFSSQQLVIPVLPHEEGLDHEFTSRSLESLAYWLHQLPNEAFDIEISKAMNKSIFKFRKQRGTGRPVYK